MLATKEKTNDILIVDDTPENLTVLRAILIKEGYRVRPAINGEIALKAVEAEHPDLILLDIMMPGMDGYELCEHLKANPDTSDIPVLFISALNGTSDKVKGFKLGGVDFITKPFQCEEVLSRVENHITLRNMQKELMERNLQLTNEIQERKRVEKSLESANRVLRRMAALDGLTLIANRRHFNKVIMDEWLRLAREKKPLSLIMCDIDNFKKFNDYYGHLKGDECLKKVAQCLKNTILRPADMVARYGGEEFAILLPNTDRKGAYKIAEKILQEIRDKHIPHQESNVASHVTLSLGVSCRVPLHTSTPEILIDDADTALYKAKESGKNRIIIH